MYVEKIIPGVQETRQISMGAWAGIMSHKHPGPDSTNVSATGFYSLLSPKFCSGEWRGATQNIGWSNPKGRKSAHYKCAFPFLILEGLVARWQDGLLAILLLLLLSSSSLLLLMGESLFFFAGIILWPCLQSAVSRTSLSRASCEQCPF